MGAVLVVWHGDFGDGLRRFLTADAQRHVLVIGEGVVPINDHEPPGREFPGRLRSFKLTAVRSWGEHPAWKRATLTSFFRAVRHEDVTIPPWMLLIPPVAPEHVLACYLCSVAGMQPEPLWVKGFGEEVSYWTTERNVNPILDWDDRTNKEKLKEFLAAVGALQPPLQNWVGNALD